jgi:hypothetical protein
MSIDFLHSGGGNGAGGFFIGGSGEIKVGDGKPEPPVNLGSVEQGQRSRYWQMALRDRVGLQIGMALVPRAVCAPEDVARIDAELAAVPAELRIPLQDASGLTLDRKIAVRLEVPKWQVVPDNAQHELATTVPLVFSLTDAIKIFADARRELDERRALLARRLEEQRERETEQQRLREQQEQRTRADYARAQAWQKLPPAARAIIRKLHTLDAHSIEHRVLSLLAEVLVADDRNREGELLPPPAAWNP